MIQKSLKRGFTLIELLVVIAIIGILASVVLASLGTAREKGRDAAAKSSMSQMRAEAELGTDDAGTYLPDLCESGSTGVSGNVYDLLTAAEAQVPTAGSCGQDAATTVRPDAWGAAIDLNDGTVYCVDSTGFAGASTAADAATEIADGLSSADVVCDNA